jgi:hypothetical protein
VIDACFSSFIKGSLDEGQQAFRQVLHQLLSGAALGQVAQSAQTPPLLAQVYELAKFHRFKLDETLSKRAKLDVLRNPKHRLRSRFLHLLDFLELGRFVQYKFQEKNGFGNCKVAIWSEIEVLNF